MKIKDYVDGEEVIIEIDYKSIIGRQIRNRLKQLDVSQSVIAEDCDIKRAQMNSIVTGRNYPSIPVLIKLKDALDVDYNYFFDDNIELTTIDRYNLLYNYNKLPEEMKDAVIDFIKGMVKATQKIRK